MNDLWIKIKAWTRGIIFAAILLYATLFIYKNSSNNLEFWWWFDRIHKTSVFLLVMGSFFAGVICTLLIRALWGTWRQIRDSRTRGRVEKLQREMDDQKAKAAMLQTRPVSGEGVVVQVDRMSGGKGL